MNDQAGTKDLAGNIATNVLETESPEVTVFDATRVRVQRYFTRGGDGMIILRVDGANGDPLVSLSVFGRCSEHTRRDIPLVDVSTYDERSRVPKRSDTYPLPSVGDGRVRYLMVGESEEAVRRSAEEFRRGWGLAYNPMVGNPRMRQDGKWIAEATRWASAE